MKLDPREARQILRQCDFAALATQSARLPGYPFISHVPVALDGAGRPLMLFSRLAEHTRNLAADPRASLMVSVPGPDPQAQPRLTLLGDLRPAEVDAAQRARYLRYHPDGADFLGFGDFSFYRLEVLRVRLVGGFARAGWIEAAWPPRPLPEDEEADLVARLQTETPPDWDVLGLDWEGLDLRISAAGRLRLAWGESPASPADLLQAASSQLAAQGAASYLPGR